MGSIPVCLILPELLSAPGGPHLSLSYCLFLGQSLSLHPTAGRGQAANLQPSVLVQRRHSPAQRVPSTVGDTECRRDEGDLFAHHQGSGTVIIVSGRPPKCKDQLKAYEVYVIVSGGDPRMPIQVLFSFHPDSIFLGHLFYLIRKWVLLKVFPKYSSWSWRWWWWNDDNNHSIIKTYVGIHMPEDGVIFNLVCYFICIGSVNVSVTNSCPTLYNPMDCLPGSSVNGILQARILEWVAIPFSRGSSQSRDQTWVTCITGRFFTIWATRETARTLEWVAILFFRGSSKPRDWTQVSSNADRFFILWANREALYLHSYPPKESNMYYYLFPPEDKNFNFNVILIRLCGREGDKVRFKCRQWNSIYKAPWQYCHLWHSIYRAKVTLHLQVTLTVFSTANPANI